MRIATTAQYTGSFIPNRNRSIDASGRALKRATIQGHQLTMNMEELKPGLYLLYLKDGQVIKLVNIKQTTLKPT